MWQSNTIWANDNTLSMHKRSRESHDADTIRLPSYNYTNSNTISLSTTSSSNNNINLPETPTSTNTSTTMKSISELESTNTSSHSLSTYIETSSSSESTSSSLISPSITTRSSSSHSWTSSHVPLRTISSNSSVTAVATPLSSHPPASSPFRKLRGTSLHTRSLSHSSSSLKASFTIPSIPLPAALDNGTTTPTYSNSNNAIMNTNMQSNSCTSEEKNIILEKINNHAICNCKDNDDGVAKTTFVEEKSNDKTQNNEETDIWSILFSVDSVHSYNEAMEYKEIAKKECTMNEKSSTNEFLKSTDDIQQEKSVESTMDSYVPLQTNKNVFYASEKTSDAHSIIDAQEESIESSNNQEEDFDEDKGKEDTKEQNNINTASVSNHAFDRENTDLRSEENENREENDKTHETSETMIKDVNRITDNNFYFDFSVNNESARLEEDNKLLEESVNVISVENNEHAMQWMIDETHQHAEMLNLIPGSLQTLNTLQQVTQNNKKVQKLPESEHFHDFVKQIIPCVVSPLLLYAKDSNTNTSHLFQRRLLQTTLRRHLFQTWKSQQSVTEELLSLVECYTNSSNKKSCKLLHKKASTVPQRETLIHEYQEEQYEAYNHTESYLVEWNNGSIGCTNDVMGLMHEDHIRQAHIYYLPPLPSPVYNKPKLSIEHNEQVVKGTDSSNDDDDDDDDEEEEEEGLSSSTNEMTPEQENVNGQVKKRKRRRLELKLSDSLVSNEHSDTENFSLCNVAEEQLHRLTWLHAERASFMQTETHHSASQRQIDNDDNYKFCKYYCNGKKETCNVSNTNSTKIQKEFEYLSSSTPIIITPSFCPCYQCCPIELNYVQIKLFPSAWYVYMSIWHQTNSIDDILLNFLSKKGKDKCARKKRNRTNNVQQCIEKERIISGKEEEQHETFEEEEHNNIKKNNVNKELEEQMLIMFPHLKMSQCFKDNIHNALNSFPANSETQILQTQLAHDVFEELTLFALTPHNMPHQLKLLPFSHALAKLLHVELEKRIDIYIHHILPHTVQQMKENEMYTFGKLLYHNLEFHYVESIMQTIHNGVPDRTWEILTREWSWLNKQSKYKFGEEKQEETHKEKVSLYEHVLMLHVEYVAKEHGAAILESVALQIVHSMLIALKFQLHRRLRVMYEIIRIQLSLSLRTCNRTQLMQLRQWYAFTPSPQCLLNLMQTFTLLRYALNKTFAHLMHTCTDINVNNYEIVNSNKSNVKETRDDNHCSRVKSQNQQLQCNVHENTFSDNHNTEYRNKKKKIRTLSLAVHSDTNTVMNKVVKCFQHPSVHANERCSISTESTQYCSTRHDEFQEWWLIENAQCNKTNNVIHEMMLIDNNYTHILTEHARHKHHKHGSTNTTSNSSKNKGDINLTFEELYTVYKSKENVENSSRNNNTLFEDAALKVVLRFIDKHQRTPTLEEMDVLVKPQATRKTRREHRRAERKEALTMV